VIGARPDLGDLPAEIDLYCDDPAELMDKLERGDDFAHWTLRHGCVLFDSGALREAATEAAERDLWPDPERKLRQARHALEFAERLLAHDVFSLARAELPAQLRDLHQPALARALEEAIHEGPDPDSLAASLKAARSLAG
jgi:hypothetical protein